MFDNMTLEKYCEVLASKAPTPGGGSALAVVGSVASALVEMSINVTLNKLTPESPNYDELNKFSTFFVRARARFLQLADDDAAAFQKIIECMHLPKNSEEEQKTRESELQKAYHRAALVPLDVMRIANESFKHAQNSVMPHLYKYVASDCAIGMDLYIAIVKNSLTNVYANTNLITDVTLRSTLENYGQDLVAGLKYPL